jgi:hypothetical protein
MQFLYVLHLKESHVKRVHYKPYERATKREYNDDDYDYDDEV